MGYFDTDYTCPIIDGCIDDTKSVFFDFIGEFMEEMNELYYNNHPDLNTFIKGKVDELYSNVEDTFETLRKSNEDLRYDAEQKLEEAQDRINELEDEVKYLEGQIE